jgi:hypothetical protein
MATTFAWHSCTPVTARGGGKVDRGEGGEEEEEGGGGVALEDVLVGGLLKLPYVLHRLVLADRLMSLLPGVSQHCGVRSAMGGKKNKTRKKILESRMHTSSAVYMTNNLFVGIPMCSLLTFSPHFSVGMHALWLVADAGAFSFLLLHALCLVLPVQEHVWLICP